MIILDTNVISELVRPNPSPQVLDVLRAVPSDDLFTTAITEGEIRYGLALLPRRRKRRLLESQIDSMLNQDFAGRIVPFDSQAAKVYAQLVAGRREKGRPISLADGQIAAIVSAHHATLLSRNARDFHDYGFRVVDPWKSTIA